MVFQNPRPHRASLAIFLGFCLTVTPNAIGQLPFLPQFSNRRQANTLADLSGMVWMGGDSFVAVHDAKVKDELVKPRVANLNLPVGLQGITYIDLRPTYRGIVPNDLESVSRIPGSNKVLLVESGDSKNDPSIQRIFKASVRCNQVKIVSKTNWPVKITNVEGTAVAKVGNKYVFLFAERADNQTSTNLTWIELNPRRMEFSDTVRHVKFNSPDPQRYNRVIVGLDVDSGGNIYSVSAFDAEAAGQKVPDPDNGPFAAGVYIIGKIQLENEVPEVNLFDPPVEIGTIDGFKVETVAVREENGESQVFIGTDDENYGGTFRQLAMPVLND